MDIVITGNTQKPQLQLHVGKKIASKSGLYHIS